MKPASSSANGSEGTARWLLRLLGGFELAALPAGERLTLPGKRERLLLAYLALSPNGRASRRKLTSLLWQDTAEEAALHSLRNCLSVLRKALGDAEHRTLSSQGEDIVLYLSAFDTDVLAFRRLAANSGGAELEAAAELCSGDLLDGLGIEGEEFESWRRTESACHRDQSVDVFMRLMAQFEEAGEAERAIKTGTRILGFEPLHEVAARRLMRLYGRSGRRGAAIGVYRSLAAALRDEVGAEPEAETRALFVDLSRGTEDSLAPPPSAGRDLRPRAPTVSESVGVMPRESGSSSNHRTTGRAATEIPWFLDRPLSRAMTFLEGFISGRTLAPPSEAAPRPERETLPPLESAAVLSPTTAPFKMPVPSNQRSYKLFGIAGAVLAGVVLAMFLRPQLIAPSRIGSTTQATKNATNTVNMGTSPSRDAVTIAVLPFANLSADASQEFFSDGITEEINTALAKVPGLSVIARTSAFALKGENKDARTLGQVLGASHLIEGSVRKAGQRVRIASQLVRASDGVELWSQSYERNLTDIFAVQEEIATSIIGALRVPLGLSHGENLVNNRSIDPESYEDYLRGKALWEARTPSGVADNPTLAEAAVLLAGVVAKNPAYAPAWAFLGGVYFSLASHSATQADIAEARAAADEFRIKGEAADQKSGQLDANFAMAHNGLAVFAWTRAKPLEAEELFKKALALDPLEPSALGAYGIRIGSAGRLKEALDLTERAHRVDPFYPNVGSFTVDNRWLNGQTEAALALAKTLRPRDRATSLALIYASLRRFGEAADALMELAGGDPHSDAAEAARLLRMAPAKPASTGTLPRLPPGLSMLYLYLGAPERALEPYERLADVGFISGNRGTVWHADYAPVRKTERFKALMKKAGLVEYWRVKGWPEQCHPTTGEDFECD